MFTDKIFLGRKDHTGLNFDVYSRHCNKTSDLHPKRFFSLGEDSVLVGKHWSLLIYAKLHNEGSI